MVTWDADQYLKYAAERGRPARDLLARLEPAAEPSPIYDLGCGTGTSTRLLVERWPGARIIGIDSSPAMLEKARGLGLGASFLQAELDHFEATAPAGLCFSNAALHWVGDHERLFPHLVAQLRPGGLLAVQMPHSFACSSHRLLREVLESGGPGGTPLGTAALRARYRRAPTLDPAEYYDLLSPLVEHLDVWQTEYLHVLEGPDPVLEWVKGTALRPLLDTLDAHDSHDALDGEQRACFLEQYRLRLAEAYPPRADGKTLYPFPRLFLVARV